MSGTIIYLMINMKWFNVVQLFLLYKKSELSPQNIKSELSPQNIKSELSPQNIKSELSPQNLIFLNPNLGNLMS